MKKIIFDIETDGIITNVGGKEVFPNMYVVCIYDSETNKYQSFTQEQLKDLWPILEKADLLIGYNNDGYDTPLLTKEELIMELRKIKGKFIMSYDYNEDNLEFFKEFNVLPVDTIYAVHTKGRDKKFKELLISNFKIE
jgi:hypothetical protein